MNFFVLSILGLVFYIILYFIKDTIKRFKTGYWSFSKNKFDEIYPKGILNFWSGQAGQFKFNRYQSNKFGRSFRQWLPGKYIFNVIRAAEVEKVLTSHKQISKNEVYEFLHPFLRTGLLTSGGSKWMKRRRILTPAFHFNILQQFYTIFIEQTNRFISNLKITENDTGTDLTQLLPEFTLNTLLETAMGVKLNESAESRTYRECIHDVGKFLVIRACRPWLHSDFIYKLFGYQKELEGIVDPVHKFSKNVIKVRRSEFHDFQDGNPDPEFFQNDENIYESKKRRYAMLDTLLAAERDGLIDPEATEEEVDTFMFAGHDTTSVALTFILFLLAHNPDAQDKILQEVKETQEMRGTQEISLADLNNMKYLDCVIKECLRIYPPVPFIARRTSEEVDYDGMVIPADSSINFHIFDLHRDPNQFPDPDKFNPDHFLLENVEKRHPFAYIPFSAGPRNCIGQKFALLEIKTFITKFLQGFQILPVTEPSELIFLADLVLRTQNPVKVLFKLRN